MSDSAIAADGDGRPVAVFRADARATVGGGHVARCLSIASVLHRRGWDCILITGAGLTVAAPSLASSPVRIVEGDPATLSDPERVGAAVAGSAEIGIVDHYGLGADFEAGCRSWARRVLAIEDLPNRVHDCDILLDQTPDRTATAYAGLVPKSATLLLGPAYALVAPAFREAREAALARRRDARPGQHLLVAPGAMDHANVTGRVLCELNKADWDGPTTVLLSPAAPHLAEVRRLVDARPGSARLLVGADPERVAAALAEADLAVGAAGVSTWERCCLGLPTVLLIVADNQCDIARTVEGAGAALLLGRLEAQATGAIADAVMALADDPDQRRHMAECASQVCDGAGPERVADVIEREI